MLYYLYKTIAKVKQMKDRTRKAFTMVELVFVIVVIGILAAIAIPKLAATRDDAEIANARTTVASVRSSLSTERQKNVLKGEFDEINATAINEDFSNLLEYSVKTCATSGCGGWSKSGTNWTFHGPTGDVVFELDDNRFECDSGPCATYE